MNIYKSINEIVKYKNYIFNIPREECERKLKDKNIKNMHIFRKASDNKSYAISKFDKEKNEVLNLKKLKNEIELYEFDKKWLEAYQKTKTTPDTQLEEIKSKYPEYMIYILIQKNIYNLNEWFQQSDFLQENQK